MTPVHVTDGLSAYLDGQMPADERAKIAAHLETCTVCRAHLDALRQTVAILRTVEPLRAPEGFRQQVRVRVAGEARRPARAWRLPPWTRSWKAAGAVAAAVLVGLFSVNVVRQQLPTALQERGVPRGEVAPPAETVDRALSRPGVATPRTGLLVPSAPVAPGAILPSLRRVIRTGQVTLEVESVDEAASRLTRLAEAAGGFVAGASSMQSGRTPEGSFVLRVPASRFADVLAQVEALGRVLGRRLSGQDVTEEYVDLRSRIRNQERYEQRLLAFVDRATRISDLLAIEQELARVRGEIEQLTGRLQYLERQVDLATIEVFVRETAKQGSVWDVNDTLAKIRAAFLLTIRQILRAVEALAIAFSALLPILVLVGAAWLLIRRVRSARG